MFVRSKFHVLLFSCLFLFSGMVSKTAVVSLIGLLGMVYQATQLPPPPKSDPAGGFVVDIDVDDNGDGLVDAARIRLSDGRYLAYREKGVSKNESNYRIVLVHGFGSSKEMNFPASQVLTLNSSLNNTYIEICTKICDMDEYQKVNYIKD